MNRCNSR